MSTEAAIRTLKDALAFAALPYSERTQLDHAGKVVSTNDHTKLGFLISAMGEALGLLGVDASEIPSGK